MSATNMNLRDYQEAAVTSAIDFLKRGVNPLVIAPTGAGKTVIASEIMKRWMSANPGKMVVFVAHRKELLSQAKATMERFGILDNAMNMLGISSYVQILLKGAVIVGIIYMDCFYQKRKRELV